MKAILSINMNLDTHQECYGVVIQMQPKSIYCKYMQGMQSFKTKEEAVKHVSEVNDKLKNGFSPFCKKTMNRIEYVALERISTSGNFLVDQHSGLADDTNNQIV